MLSEGAKQGEWLSILVLIPTVRIHLRGHTGVKLSYWRHTGGHTGVVKHLQTHISTTQQVDIQICKDIFCSP